MSNSSNNSGLATFGGIIVIALGVIAVLIGGFLYGTIVCGYVGMKLWAWFIVPTFGVKALTWIQAWGVAMLVAFWTHQHALDNVKDERDTATKVGSMVGVLLAPWITLFLAWLGKIWFF